jgi:hypothetical protein
MDVKNEHSLKSFIKLHNDIKRGNSPKTAMLVKYYMDGCPACIRLKPEWDVAERNSPHKHVQFVTLNHKYMSRSPIPPVNQFPTIKLIKVAGIHTFDKDRTAQNLLSFILKHSGKGARSNFKTRRGVTVRKRGRRRKSNRLRRKKPKRGSRKKIKQHGGTCTCDKTY